MAIEFSVSLANRPGTLAALAEALAAHGVNIIGVHAAACQESGSVQFVTNNTDATIAALRDASISYTTTEVLLVTLANQPGMLARLARGLAAQNININAIYIAMSGQVVVDVSDINEAQKVILSLDLGTNRGSS